MLDCIVSAIHWSRFVVGFSNARATSRSCLPPFFAPFPSHTAVLVRCVFTVLFLPPPCGCSAKISHRHMFFQWSLFSHCHFGRYSLQ